MQPMTEIKSRYGITQTGIKIVVGISWAMYVVVAASGIVVGATSGDESALMVGLAVMFGGFFFVVILTSLLVAILAIIESRNLNAAILRELRRSSHSANA